MRFLSRYRVLRYHPCWSDFGLCVSFQVSSCDIVLIGVDLRSCGGVFSDIIFNVGLPRLMVEISLCSRFPGVQRGQLCIVVGNIGLVVRDGLRSFPSF